VVCVWTLVDSPNSLAKIEKVTATHNGPFSECYIKGIWSRTAQEVLSETRLAASGMRPSLAVGKSEHAARGQFWAPHLRHLGRTTHRLTPSFSTSPTRNWMACNTLSRPGDPGDAVWILNVARGGRGVPPSPSIPWALDQRVCRPAVDANLPALISAAPCAVCLHPARVDEGR
jgi:hypothetical protein